MNDRVEALIELIKFTSTNLPDDVTKALEEARKKEENKTAEQIFGAILENVRMSKENSSPICQDTGTPLFFVQYPHGESTRHLESEIQEAVRKATEQTYLRPNAVDSITGKNSGNNIGLGMPHVSFYESDGEDLRIMLMLKGGGSENVAMQYKLPDNALKAGRDLEGVRKCILDTAYQAQGKGCAPGILGVCIGSDRGSGYYQSKKEMLRPLYDTNDNPVLAMLEEKVLSEINQLGIGPMGLGGKTTVLGVKIGALHRVPACYFVTVSYLCWAARRHTMTISKGEVHYD
jgi:fumarate hydratase class I